MDPNAAALKGAYLKSIEVDHEVLVGEPDSITWTLNKVPRGADTAVAELFDRGGIDEKEFLRIVYRMGGEVLPEGPVPNMERRPLKPVTASSPYPNAKRVKAAPGGAGEPPSINENP